ncbi:N-acetyl-alpha-D-glucosaminyl-diphospho-ditrans, octacis-undecaprenol 3-alpha-mannosyltransferase / rhamnosyltransferase [Thermoflexales bacterium]|nr:N-acetyl-alpha-D-glucosaminyl-diphospho-ditrans, octacis-undecaprenol 3-alpha-mannosyltransferase / rhamnosyltransferase [Thermoflexales bacterium]
MKILLALTYYRPHTSGLTIYAERLARALADRGHRVTVLTSQYDKALPREEHLHGVDIVRVPVAFRVSKGVIMPTFGAVAWKMVRAHDVLSLHLPQFDASGLAARGRLLKKPVTLTYHCDLQLPPGLFSRIIDKVVFGSNILAAQFADTIVAYTQDYATHSPFLSRYLNKVKVIPPPVHVPDVTSDEIAAFSAKWNLAGQRVIGFAARLATEKGVEIMLEALPRVLQAHPTARVLFAGPYQNVLGEEAYAKRIMPLVERYQDHWAFLGVLSPREMAAFFHNCAVTVLPSLNSTESFGLVQVEGMLCGAPSIASVLPGVRQPVLTTGMGEVVPIGDSAALAEAIVRILNDKTKYTRPRADIEALFSTPHTAELYEKLFEDLLAQKKGVSAASKYHESTNENTG